MLFRSTDDDGSHPSSPFHKEIFIEKCPECGHGCNELNTVEYMLRTDGEEVPTKEKEMCDDCLSHFKKNENFILI